MENVVAAITGVAPVPITCLTFENGMQRSTGISLKAPNVVIHSSANYGHVAIFNGKSSKIEVPSLANTYRYDLRVLVYIGPLFIYE